MKFLSEEFVAHPALAGLPTLAGGFDGRLQTVVAGGPDGDVKILSTFAAGRCTGSTIEVDKGAELTLTFRHPDLVALVAGDADLNALFITGRMKTDGPTGPLLDLIVAVQSVEGRAVLAELHAAVDEA